MNLLESINKITTEKQADTFISSTLPQIVNVDDIIFCIKQKIQPENVRALDEGMAYYKVVSNDKAIISGNINLFAEKIVKAIKESEIDDTLKVSLIENFDKTTKLIISLFDQQYAFISSILKQKKGIDALRISYIMLGYAIETIRKIYNSKSQ